MLRRHVWDIVCVILFAVLIGAQIILDYRANM